MIETKEKTALCTSVGADERQSIQNTNRIIPTSDAEINHQFENSEENLEEMFRQMQRMASPYYLHTVSLTELYQTAYHISTGTPLWKLEVHQGSVLYLALEDDYQRIQSRMFMMYGIEDSDHLHFATAANKIGSGLDEQLEFFIQDHPNTKLIIIDTMQKIREVGGEAYSYASDYEIINLDGMEERERYEEIIRDNLEVDILSQDSRYDIDRVNEMIEVMLDAICSTSPTLRINNTDMPKEAVKSRLLKLNSSHIDYVFDAMRKNPSDIRNIRAYMLTTLYGRPARMSF